MEPYIVSARKYRPSTFATVVGQPALTATLKNAVAEHRLAHAYLFCGSRGVGKTSCARIFAKTINCTNPTADGEACNECESCRSFNAGTSSNIIELDAASHNGIDDMRAVTDQVVIPPVGGKYRVFIIDEVHMLSTAAFNAFLKTLEEPPSYVVFILATTEKHKVIPTILSRCQIYDFNRITIRDMVSHLAYVASQEGITADPAALAVIASKADGAMRDALSIFDQVASSSRGNITYQSAIDNLNVLDHAYYRRLVEAFLACDVPTALKIYKEIRDKGFDSQFFINGLALYLRDLMLACNAATLPLLEVPDETRAEMADTASRCKPEFLYRAMDLCNDADLNFRQASNKQFLIELTLIKLCQSAGPSSKGDTGEGQLKPITVATSAAPAAAAQTAAPAHSAPTAAPAPGPAPQATKTAAPAAAATMPPSRPAPSRPAPDGPAPRLRVPGLSLRRQGQDAEGVPTAAQGDTLAETYSDSDVVRAWSEFMEEHASEVLLVNTMRKAMPGRTAPDTYSVVVENDVQSGILMQGMSEILTFIRKKIRNDRFNIVTEVTDGPGSPKTWTEQEVLADIRRRNSDFADFVDDFKLTLL